MFNTIEIDRSNLTIMGVKFSDLKTLESTANALGSNMFEGYKPTPKGIEIIRDYVTGKISLTELVAFAKQKPMSNSYKYIDPDFTYTDPKTGLLRNLQDITDPDVLLFVESGAVTKRLQELYEHPLKIKSIDSLFEIHRHLFQDIYVWAGKKRNVEISKDGKQFFPTSHFDNALRYIDQLIAEFKKIQEDNKKLLAEKLAEILDNVNYLHPFREGNGRTQREFLRLLALEKGLILNLNPPDNKSVYERYMKGTIESDVKTLTELIFELIDTNDK